VHERNEIERNNAPDRHFASQEYALQIPGNDWDNVDANSVNDPVATSGEASRPGVNPGARRGKAC
jgi:hypothetical protein